MANLQYFQKRAKALESQRDRYKSLWTQIAKNFVPYRGRFALDESQGTDKYADLLNNKPALSMRVLTAGLMSGMTSPARPWFRLSTGDVTLDERDDVKQWLYDCREIMLNLFSRTNVYNSLQTFYNEISTFSTAALGMYEDDEVFVRYEALTAGQYAVGLNNKNIVDSIVIRRKRTISAIVKEYGLENVPTPVRNLWQRGELEEKMEIVNLIEPNDNRGGSVFSYDLPFRSVTWVEGVGGNEAILRQSGYNEFPFAVARWDVVTGEAYGTDSPALMALGDAKGLQLIERDLLQVADRMADPAMLADKDLRRSLGNRAPVPGSMHYVDDPSKDIRALGQEGRTTLSEMTALSQRQEDRIDAAFYVDMFLMLASSDRREMTAREVSERHEEKLLQLGPVLERLQDELLNPLVSRTFSILQRSRVLPDPPEELADVELSVVYISLLAQAQRLVSQQNVDRLMDTAGALMSFDPNIAQKLNVERILDTYADVLGVAPDLLKTQDQYAQLLEAARQQQQQQEAMAAASQMADVAHKASQTQLEKPSGLSEIMRRGGMM